MKNPREFLNKYLKNLINNLLYVKSLDEQLKIMQSWDSPRRVEAIRIGSHFFSLVVYSFQRVIFIELHKMLSSGEKRSIRDFLMKLKQHISSAKPMRYNPETEGREPYPQDDYVAHIDGHLEQISRNDDLLKRIKGLRDKVIVHADTIYHDDPLSVLKEYHIDETELDELLELLSEILRFHHCYLFDSDLEIKVHSASDLNSILVNVRAFDRIWHNKHLNNLKKYVFKLDDYDANVIYMNEPAE